MSATAIIVAGGSGQRFGSSLPKQFLHLLGKPILSRTLEVFDKASSVRHVVLVLPQDKISYFEQEVLPFHPVAKLQSVVEGGASRQESTLAGFEAVLPHTEVVIVHDAARPLLEPELIDRCAETAITVGAVIAACPASDTIKEVDPQGHIRHTHPREHIYQAQTPQAFRYSVLKEAMEWAHRHSFQGTDEASLVEKLGKPVTIVKTNASNLKITTAQDLVVAEALLKMRK